MLSYPYRQIACDRLGQVGVRPYADVRSAFYGVQHRSLNQT